MAEAWEDTKLEEHRIRIPVGFQQEQHQQQHNEEEDDDDGGGSSPFFLRSIFLIYDFVEGSAEEELVSQLEANDHRLKRARGRRVAQFGGIPHPKGMMASPLPHWLDALGERMRSRFDAFGDNEKPNHVLVNEYRPGDGIMPHTDGDLYKAHFGIVSLLGTVVMNFYKREGTDPRRQLVEVDTDSGSLGSSFSEEQNSVDSHGAPEGDPGDVEGRELIFRVILPPRSLLVVTEDLYESFLHGIDFSEEDVLDDKVVNLAETGFRVGDTVVRSPRRISFTIRKVKRVLRSNILLGMRK